MQKIYNYTLYLRDGQTERENISASHEDIARKSLTGIVRSRDEVVFGELDSLDDKPFGYDWDEEAKGWQSRLF